MATPGERPLGTKVRIPVAKGQSEARTYFLKPHKSVPAHKMKLKFRGLGAPVNHGSKGIERIIAKYVERNLSEETLRLSGLFVDQALPAMPIEMEVRGVGVVRLEAKGKFLRYSLTKHGKFRSLPLATGSETNASIAKRRIRDQLERFGFGRVSVNFGLSEPSANEAGPKEQTVILEGDADFFARSHSELADALRASKEMIAEADRVLLRLEGKNEPD